jgi:hypothetical protein
MEKNGRSVRNVTKPSAPGRGGGSVGLLRVAKSVGQSSIKDGADPKKRNQLLARRRSSIQKSKQNHHAL